VLVVARELLGKILVHDTPEGRRSGRIVEVEAYRGPDDRAAHSYGGRRTRRTEVMYGPAGHAYVFFVYGMHWHFNIVTTGVGEPHAVLVRAVEPLEGKALMAESRGSASPRGARRSRTNQPSSESPLLTNGPGKLCSAFAIDGTCYGLDLTGSSRLFVCEGPRVRHACSPRVGVDYAGEWAGVPWRFFDPNSRFVSPARPRAEVCKVPK
jgi:DNA-3-methyladenine glycosylase